MVAASVLPLLSACLQPPWENPPIDTMFDGQAMPHQRLVGEPPLNLVSSGLPLGEHAPVILFLHGSPGSWDGWARYLADPALQQQATLLAIDRPGFGASPGPVEPSFAGQVERLAPVMRLLPHGRQTIVVGHSLGGPIALQLAARFADKIAALLLVAPSLDPALEAPRWYNHMANWQLLRWALPDAIRRSNSEMMQLQTELRGQQLIWPRLTVPTVVMQGGKDKLVYPANADYAEARLSAPQLRVVRLPKAGHFVIWNQRPQVVAELQRLLSAHSRQR